VLNKDDGADAAELPGAPAPEAKPEGPEEEKASWNLEPGAEIASGRSILKRLSGGNRYEVFLTWDDRLFAITVTKILRLTRLRTSTRSANFSGRWRCSGGSHTPVWYAVSTQCSTALIRT
jgi:hypothetical protein